MAVTRIKNNQISDSTITYQKIASGTLTGSLFNANLTLNSNVTIAGNLTVSGNTSTVNSIDTLVSDPLLTLNSGYVGTPAYDVGLLVNRALGSIGNYGGMNAAWVWREADGAFEPILTTDTGSTAGTVNRNFYANIIAGNIQTVYGFSAATALFGSINNTPIGNATPSTGAFTSLSSTLVTVIGGNLVAAATTTSTNSQTGALVVKGGAGIAGTMQVDGIVKFNDTTENTGPNTGAFQVTAGGAYIAGNLFVGGNINLSTANVSTITGNAGQFFGDTNGFGALYAGVTSGFTYQPQTVLEVTGNYDGYVQLNVQNLSSGTDASGDVIVTADSGDADGGYIDMGINSSGYAIVAGNELQQPLDGYVYVHGGTPGMTGNLLLGTIHATDIIFASNGFATVNEQARFKNNVGLIVKQGTTTTTANTGALQVWGGAAIGENLYVGGNITVAGATAFAAINGSTATFVTVNATSANIIGGNATTFVITNFSTGNARVTGGYADNFPIGANTASTGSFTTANAATINAATTTTAALNSTTGNITTLTSTTVNAGTTTAAALNSTTGNITTGNIVTLNTTTANIINEKVTTLVATNFGSGNAQVTGGYADDFPIGANVASTGRFTFANATGMYSIDATVVNLNGTTGNITTLTSTTVNAGTTTTATLNATTGNITTLTIGNITVWGVNATSANAITAVASNFSTGNAVITGGSVNNAPIGNTTPSTGNFTTVNAVTANATSVDSYTTNATTVNATTGNVTTLGAGTTTTAILNTTTANITSEVVTTGVTTNFSTGNARVTGGYADNFPIGANTASTGNFTTANAATVNAATTTTATLNSTTGNITTLTSTTVNAGTTTTATLNATTGNVTTLGAATTTTATLNTTTANITSEVISTGVTTNFSTGNAVITGGSVNSAPIGNTTPSTGNFTTANAKTVDSYTTNATTLNATTANVTDGKTTTLVATNFSSGNARISSGYADNFPIGANTASTGNFTTVNAVTANATTVDSYTTNATTLNATTANITTLTAPSINTGNVTVWAVNATHGNITTLVATTGFSTGNARVSGGYADNFPIGANTQATGGFTTLTATAATTFTSATQSDTSSTGALVVTGGVGIGANLNVGGNITVTGNLTVQGTTTTVNSATLDVADLNVTVAKGAASAAAANGAGITVDGANATITYLNADDSWNFNKKVNSPSMTLPVLNVTSANLLTGVIGNLSSGNAIITGGNITGINYVTATHVTGTYANVTDLIAQSVQIFGGNATNMWSVATNNAIITGGTINNTPIGNSTASTGKFTTVNAATVNVALLNNTDGNVTTLVATNFGTGNAVITGGSIDNAPIGATTASTGNFIVANVNTIDAYLTNSMELNATIGNVTTLVATNFGTGNAVITGGSVNNAPIGNTTPSTGNFTTANAATVTAYTTNSTTLNATAGNITTLGVTGVLTGSGNIVAASGTASTNTTTGALVVVGGAGVSGSLNIGANVIAGNVISSTYYSAGGTTRFELTDIGLVTVDVAGAQFKFGAGGIESSPGIFGGAFGGSKLSLNSETNLIANRLDIVKIQTGTDGSIQNEWTFSNNALTTPGTITAGGNIVAASGTASTNTTTGALVVVGGIGVSGALNIGGDLAAASASFVAINNTIIGNTTPAAGTFTNLAATTLVTTNFSSGNARVTGGYADNLPVGANTASTGNFTTANAATVDSYTTNATALNATTGNVTTLTSTTVNAGTTTTAIINATTGNIGTLTATAGFGTANARITGGYLDGTAIGANTASTGNFTTANAATVDSYTTNAATVNATAGNIVTLSANNFSTSNARITGGYIDGTAIGATVANSGAFTTVTTSGEAKLTTLNVTANVYLAPQSGVQTVTINPGIIGTIDNMSVGATNAANVYASNFRATTSLHAAPTGPVWIYGGTGTSGINNIPIGATAPSTGVFTNANTQNLTSTTLNATNGNITTLYADNFSSGNVVVAGVFKATGNLVAAATTASTNTTTGALVVRGGAGIAGDVNIGNSLAVDASAYGNVTLTKFASVFAAGAGANSSSLMQAASQNFASGMGMWAFVGFDARLYSSNGIQFVTGITVRDKDVPTGGTTYVRIDQGGNLYANSGTTSTSTSSGALRVVGGIGVSGNIVSGGSVTLTGSLTIGGNINSSGNIVVNSNQSASTDFVVRGANENSLLFVVADTTYDQVGIGGNLTAATITQGAKLVVNSQDSILLPVGPTSERPSAKGYTDVDGMIRFNSTSGALEYYGSGQWNNTGSTFTVITQRTFESLTGDVNGNVNGSNTQFTLTANSTTNGTLVSINGVMQIPSTAYSVTGAVVTFTEAPAIGDVIDTRVITTTATVSAVASPNGFNQFSASNDHLSFYTGNLLLGTVENWRIDTAGDLYPVTTSNIGAPGNRVDYLFVSNINMQGGTLVGATVGGGSLDDTPIGSNIAALGSFTSVYVNDALQVNAAITTDDIRGKYVAAAGTDAVYSFNKTVYRSGKFFVQLTDNSGGEYQATEVILVQNGTVASIETYGVTYTGAAQLATFSANIVASTVYLNAISASANLAIKVTPTLMKL